VTRRRRDFERDVHTAQRGVERQANGLRSEAGDVVERVKRLV
jgi:hypothetical protein